MYELTVNQYDVVTGGNILNDTASAFQTGLNSTQVGVGLVGVATGYVLGYSPPHFSFFGVMVVTGYAAYSLSSIFIADVALEVASISPSISTPAPVSAPIAA